MTDDGIPVSGTFSLNEPTVKSGEGKFSATPDQRHHGAAKALFDLSKYSLDRDGLIEVEMFGPFDSVWRDGSVGIQYSNREHLLAFKNQISDTMKVHFKSILGVDVTFVPRKRNERYGESVIRETLGATPIEGRP